MIVEEILSLIFIGSEACVSLNDAIIEFLDKKKLNNVLNNLETKGKAEKKEIMEEIKRKNSFNKRMQTIKLLEMINICQFLDESLIKYIVVKGPILSYQLYNDPFIRCYRDIDIVIDDYENRILEIMTYLKGIGYYQSFGWNIKKEIDINKFQVSERIDHHEVKLVKGIRNLHSVEIKNALSAVPRTLIPEFGIHTQIYNIEGYNVKSYDLLHSFLVLCSNVFMNSESRSSIYYGSNKILRSYYDLQSLCKKYNFGYRLKRIFLNLSQFLTYNAEISACNTVEIIWLESILKTLDKLPYSLGVTVRDVFLEAVPNQQEIVEWGYNIIERTFTECRIECITNYKKQFFQYEYPDLKINPSFVNGDIKIEEDNNDYKLLIHKRYIKGKSYKIELLADVNQHGILFRGFIINEVAVMHQKSTIFTSNAKHYEEYLDEYVEIKSSSSALTCDITELLGKSVFNGKCIFRISEVRKITDEMYQELDSASYQYCIRRQA